MSPVWIGVALPFAFAGALSVGSALREALQYKLEDIDSYGSITFDLVTAGVFFYIAAKLAGA